MLNRSLKVQYDCRRLKTTGRLSYCPVIRLKGKWLQQAGIFEGDRVSVSVKPGQITITTQ